MQKKEHSYTVGGTTNCYNHYGEQCGDSLKKLGIKLPCYPEIPLLGVHPEETKIEKDTCPQCPLQHCLQELGHGSHLDVHWQMSGYGSCGTYT